MNVNFWLLIFIFPQALAEEKKIWALKETHFLSDDNLSLLLGIKLICAVPPPLAKSFVIQVCNKLKKMKHFSVSKPVTELKFIIKLAGDDKIVNGTSSLNW